MILLICDRKDSITLLICNRNLPISCRLHLNLWFVFKLYSASWGLLPLVVFKLRYILWIDEQNLTLRRQAFTAWTLCSSGSLPCLSSPDAAKADYHIAMQASECLAIVVLTDNTLVFEEGTFFSCVWAAVAHLDKVFFLGNKLCFNHPVISSIDLFLLFSNSWLDLSCVLDSRISSQCFRSGDVHTRIKMRRLAPSFCGLEIFIFLHWLRRHLSIQILLLIICVWLHQLRWG